MTIITKIEEQKQEMDLYKNLASAAAKSGNYAGLNEMSLLNIMLSAKDFGVSPMKAINGSFYVVNGKISMSTALMSDRIRKEGHSIKIPEWTDQKCVIIGVRKDNGDSVKFEFSMEDATKAGLTNSPTWKKYPKHMLYNRAMSTLARVLFPDVVGNCYSEDEREEIKGPIKSSPSAKSEEIQVIEVPVQIEDAELTEEQRIQLAELTLGDDVLEKKICKHLGIENIYQTPAKDFDRVVSYIEKYREKIGA